jgi:hypothetical protein
VISCLHQIEEKSVHGDDELDSLATNGDAVASLGGSQGFRKALPIYLTWTPELVMIDALVVKSEKKIKLCHRIEPQRERERCNNLFLGKETVSSLTYKFTFPIFTEDKAIFHKKRRQFLFSIHSRPSVWLA